MKTKKRAQICLKLSETKKPEATEDDLVVQALKSEIAAYIESIQAERYDELEKEANDPQKEKKPDCPNDRPQGSEKPTRQERMVLANMKLKEKLEQTKEKKKMRRARVESTQPHIGNEGQQLTFMNDLGGMSVASVGNSYHQGPSTCSASYGQSSSSSVINTFPNWGGELVTRRERYPSTEVAPWVDPNWNSMVDPTQGRRQGMVFAGWKPQLYIVPRGVDFQ